MPAGSSFDCRDVASPRFGDRDREGGSALVVGGVATRAAAVSSRPARTERDHLASRVGKKLERRAAVIAQRLSTHLVTKRSWV